MTCEACEQFTPEFLSGDGSVIRHHESISALKLSASECRFCAAFVREIDCRVFLVDSEVTLVAGTETELRQTSNNTLTIKSVPEFCSLQIQVPELDVTANINYEWKSDQSVSETKLFEIADGWVRESRKKTPREVPFLPKRVLDLGFLPRVYESPNWLKLVSRFFRNVAPPTVRLLVSPETKAEYAVLSHRWGTGKTVELTRDSLASLQRGISLHALPRTFRDAAIAARRVGFRYLWIDALCIVQDDVVDWLIESAKMWDVYANAACAIAAHAAHFDGDGFLREQKTRGLQLKMPRSSFRHQVNGSHLSGRGWVFQERILSQRTLHFCAGSVFFEDEAGVLFADSPQDYSLWRDKSRTINEMAHSTADWYKLMERYTTCSFTCDGDRLPALAGLVKSTLLRLDNRTLTHYCAGLWSDTLHIGLLWLARDILTKPDKNWGAPSWSWAHWKGAIQYPTYASSVRSTLGKVDWPEGSVGGDGEVLGIKADGDSEAVTIELTAPCVSAKDLVATAPGAFVSPSELEDSQRKMVMWAKQFVTSQVKSLDSLRGLIRVKSDGGAAKSTCVGAVSFDDGETNLSECKCLWVGTWRQETPYCLNDDQNTPVIKIEEAHFVLILEGGGPWKRVGLGIIKPCNWLNSFSEQTVTLA